MVALRASLYGANTWKAAAISLRAALVILRSRRSASPPARRVAVTRISKSWSRLAVAPDASRICSMRRSRAGVPVRLGARRLTPPRVAQRSAPGAHGQTAQRGGDEGKQRARREGGGVEGGLAARVPAEPVLAAQGDGKEPDADLPAQGGEGPHDRGHGGVEQGVGHLPGRVARRQRARHVAHV